MTNTLIIDYNFYFHLSIYQIEKANERINKKNLKIRLLDNLLELRKQIKGNYSETVVAIDSTSWRKSYNPYYKFKRKENRKKDNKDWDQIHKDFAEIIEEFKENLPYKFLQIENCEGDDIIAILSKHLTSKVLIIGVDKDFEQLHRSHNIIQWNPTKQIFCDYNKDEIAYNLFAHILRGDTSDGITNILNPLNFFKEKNDKERQISLSEEYIKEAFEAAKKGNLKEFLDIPVKRNKILESSEIASKRYQRFLENKTLIDFRCIPEEVKEAVINTYTAYEVPKTNLYNYFMTNDLEQFVKDMLWF